MDPHFMRALEVIYVLVTALWMGYHFGCSMTSSWKKTDAASGAGQARD
jgi:hypothetical protein